MMAWCDHFTFPRFHGFFLPPCKREIEKLRNREKRKLRKWRNGEMENMKIGKSWKPEKTCIRLFCFLAFSISRFTYYLIIRFPFLDFQIPRFPDFGISLESERRKREKCEMATSGHHNNYTIDFLRIWL